MKTPLLKITYLLFLSIALLFVSCDDFLDLEPETSLSSALALDNVVGIEAALNGAYSIIQSDWVERQYVFAECLASNVKEVNAVNNTNYSQALRHEVWSDLFNISNYLWEMSYRGIDISNKILVALPNIPDDNGQVIADKRRLEGDALFLRGMLYFVLNRFFAQPNNGLCVPLLTQPFEAGDQPTRATIEEVKAQVIADLKAAETALDGAGSNNGRSDVWAARALLARVYFEFKDYSNAEAYANTVIENGSFSLIDGNVKAAYGTSMSSENIFSLLSTSNDRANNRLFEIFSLGGNNVEFSLSDSFWELILPLGSDLRLTTLHQDFQIARACLKYDNRNMNMPYIRLPEMYLIRAESRVNNGNLDGGLADLNRLRERAGVTATDYTDQADLLNKIFLDRSLEMSMEGDNFHNLKRLEQPIGGLPWVEARYKLVFYIPEKETQLNPNLVQNELW